MESLGQANKDSIIIVSSGKKLKTYKVKKL
jgi:hypothetical protein